MIGAGKSRKRPYTEAELALFGQYREARAAVRPTACAYCTDCWVEKGPPAIGKSGGNSPCCVACRGYIPGPRLI